MDRIRGWSWDVPSIHVVTFVVGIVSESVQRCVLIGVVC